MSRLQLEERLRELTESLIEKQTNLETLTIEYNSIQLQLKRAEVSERGERVRERGEWSHCNNLF